MGANQTSADKARDLLQQFQKRFGTPAKIYRAPGRVNLIGEHTDYNDGFVLPAAIELSCWVAIAPREDRLLNLYSDKVDQTFSVDLDGLQNCSEKRRDSWTDYPAGVAWALEQGGYRLRGANLYISSDVPIGAGLSSSAAVEVSVAYALSEISQHAIERTAMAVLCRRAENEFVGARVGIMDQFVSCHGRAGHALLLDCRSLEFRALRLPPNVQQVACNTMVDHSHAANEYNLRRSECEEAMRILREVIPGIRALRDVSLAQLKEHRSLLSPKIYRRSHHVISENNRVLKAAAAIESSSSQSGQIEILGSLLSESHRSLRDDYEVSCRELDLMVEFAAKKPGVYGARMMGGGFGGCTINLVDAAHSAEFRQRIAADYFAATGLRPDVYICEAAQGAEAIAL
ncbi:MAG: galactokinase [Candidatus Acidiferrum sp.]